MDFSSSFENRHFCPHVWASLSQFTTCQGDKNLLVTFELQHRQCILVAAVAAARHALSRRRVLWPPKAAPPTLLSRRSVIFQAIALHVVFQANWVEITAWLCWGFTLQYLPHQSGLLCCPNLTLVRNLIPEINISKYLVFIIWFLSYTQIFKKKWPAKISHNVRVQNPLWNFALQKKVLH